jgi:hypothetical protein
VAAWDTRLLRPHSIQLALLGLVKSGMVKRLALAALNVPARQALARASPDGLGGPPPRAEGGVGGLGPISRLCPTCILAKVGKAED